MTTRMLCLCCLFLSIPVSALAQGPLLWEVQEDVHGGVDGVRAIELSHKTAIIAGNAGRPDGNDLVIRALNRVTGAVEWSDSAVLSNCSFCQEPVQLATLRDVAFVVTGLLGDPGDLRGRDVLLRAYHVATGSLLWEDVWEGDFYNGANAIAATSRAVVVVGSDGPYWEFGYPEGVDLFVRAHDPATGALLWADRLDIGGAHVEAWAVALNQNRVFVAGTTSPFDSTMEYLVVRAYDIFSGELKWEASRPSTSAWNLEVASGRVYVAGRAADGAYVAAYQSRNGALLWENTTGDSGQIIAVGGERLVAASSSTGGLLVRAFDARTGILQWEDRPTVPPGNSLYASAIALNQHAVYVAGRSSRTFEYSELMVRAYNTSDGTLLWDDRSHRAGVGRGGSFVLDLALGKKRLFVAGSAGVAPTATTPNALRTSDLIVRAYDIRLDQAPTAENAPED